MKALTTNSSTNKPIKSKKVVILAGAILLLGLAGAGFVYQKHVQKNQAIAKERAAYAQAERDIRLLDAKQIQLHGTAKDSGISKYCGYTSVEFGRGDLYCDVSGSVTYEVGNQAEAVDLAKNMLATLKESGIFKVTFVENNADLLNRPSPNEIYSVDISNASALNCSAVFTYFTREDRDSGYDNYPLVSVDGLQMGVGCGSRPALAPYYPIQDD